MAKRMSVLGALLIPLMVMGAAAQGLYLEVSGGKDGRGEKISYMPGMLRVEGMDGKRVTIVRMDRELVYMLDPSSKSYRQMTFDQMADWAKQSRPNEELKAKREREKLTRKQREEAEDKRSQSGAATGAAFDVKETSQTQNISGYNCTKYVVTRGGKDESSVWVTKDIPAYSSIRRDVEQMASRFAGLPAARGILDVVERVDGFPMMRERGGMTEKVTKVEQAAIPSTMFDLPQDYGMARKEAD